MGFTCDTETGKCWDEGTSPDCDAEPDKCWAPVHYSVFPYNETHDNAIFNDRVVAMRQWLAENGQPDKPLWLTEYGSLFPTIDPPGGPNYVNVSDSETARFMVESFDFLLAATDAITGLPSDGDRLVQRWFWYSLNEHRYNFGGSLYDPDSGGARTLVGDEWMLYQWSLRQPQLDLNSFHVPTAFQPGQGRNWWSRVALTGEGAEGVAFRLVAWWQLPVDWGSGWARQVSTTLGDAALSKVDTAAAWIAVDGNCPSWGGAPPPGYKWIGWVGPQENLPAQQDRWEDLVVLRGGIRVSNDEDLGAYEHIRHVLGVMWDSDGDGSPEAYTCGPGAASVLAVVP